MVFLPVFQKCTLHSIAWDYKGHSDGMGWMHGFSHSLDNH
jgi:hypothetical protein